MSNVSHTKQLWKFQEAIVIHALLKAGYNEFNIIWNEKINGVDTDVGLKDSKGNLIALFQVRHSGSSKNQETKFWREIHEIIAAKTTSVSTRNIAVLFEMTAGKSGMSTSKGQLTDIEGFAFEDRIELEKGIETRYLVKYASALTKKTSKWPKEECLKLIKNEESIAYKRAIKKLGAQLKRVLDKRRLKNHQLWKSIASNMDSSKKLNKWENTSVKKGFAKLLIFEEQVRRSIISRSAIDLEGLDISYAKNLKLLEIRKSIRNPKGQVVISDSDILNLISHFQENEIMKMIHDAKVGNIERQYLEEIRSLASSAELIEVFIKYLTQTPSYKDFLRLLTECFKDPCAAAESFGAPSGSKRCWVIDCSMTLARVASGLSQGYGYPELAQDTGILEFMTFPGLTISQYRTRRKMPSALHLKKLGAGLYKRLLSLDLSSLGTPAEISLGSAWHIIETALIPYRELDPIRSLLEIKLCIPRNLREVRIPRHKTYLTEITRLKAATTKCTLIGGSRVKPKYVIMWQSPNKNPRDKMKEFCGRIAMLRLKASKGLPRKRYPSAKYIFIADGAWELDQINELSRFGFDHVVSPYEIADIP